MFDRDLDCRLDLKVAQSVGSVGQRVLLQTAAAGWQKPQAEHSLDPGLRHFERLGQSQAGGGVDCGVLVGWRCVYPESDEIFLRGVSEKEFVQQVEPYLQPATWHNKVRVYDRK